MPVAKLLVGKKMDKNSQQSVCKVVRKLDMSTSTAYRTLKTKLHLKPYKLHRAQDLTVERKRQSLEFSRWISDENIDPQNTISSDEKWFCLKPHSNRQNTRFWNILNSHKYDDTNKQGAENIKVWVGIVDGRNLPTV